MKENLDISIIIPSRNEEKYIQTTINRILNQKGVRKVYSYELIIVDGTSTDKTVDIILDNCKNHAEIKLIKNDKKITPVAFNLGIKNSSGKYVCILGAHSEIENDYLINCIETIENVKADNVGGPWRAKGYGYIGKAIALAFQSPFAVGNAKSHYLNYEGYVDPVWGGFYRRDVFNKIGLFDENLVRNQDDELNYRLTKSGGKIWQSTKIRYFYMCRNSIKKLFLQYFQGGFWKVLVIKKHKLPASIRHLIPGIFVSSLGLLIVLSFIMTVAFIILKGLFVAYAVFLLLATLSVSTKPYCIKYCF